jgi:hypothetical protein
MTFQYSLQRNQLGCLTKSILTAIDTFTVIEVELLVTVPLEIRPRRMCTASTDS